MKTGKNKGICLTFTGLYHLVKSVTYPFPCRLRLAKTLGLPVNQVRVISTYVGGGFGGKGDLVGADFCSTLLSKNTGRPVRISYTRAEEFISTRQRHPMILYIKTGVKKDHKSVIQTYYNGLELN